MKTQYGIGFTIFEKLDIELFNKYDIDEWSEIRGIVIPKLKNLADKMIKLGYIHDDLHASNVMIRKIKDRDEYIPIDWDESMTLTKYILFHQDKDTFPKTRNKQEFFKKLKQFIIRHVIRDMTGDNSDNSDSDNSDSDNYESDSESYKNITKIIKL